jgi:molybdopterin-guanine dinucleotide biosynthesis protein B
MMMFGLTADDPGTSCRVLRALVAELSSRGLRVSTLHEAPDDFEPDLPGKDSFEHRQAGASEVFLASDVLTALFHEERLGRAVSPADLVRRMEKVDLVLVEGFAASPHAKARIGRPQADRCDASIVAVVDPDSFDVKALADLALSRASEVQR